MLNNSRSEDCNVSTKGESTIRVLNTDQDGVIILYLELDQDREYEVRPYTVIIAGMLFITTRAYLHLDKGERGVHLLSLSPESKI